MYKSFANGKSSVYEYYHIFCIKAFSIKKITCIRVFFVPFCLEKFCMSKFSIENFDFSCKGASLGKFNA